MHCCPSVKLLTIFDLEKPIIIFTVKNNQKKLLREISSFFENVSRQLDHTTQDKPDHGREEIRKIWVTEELNEYLDFPHVG
jgi:hypothetical protein